mmetsp:Transcript_67138/g.169512  ORF Transcript_67138/g.169512 Transcript_67138/m.169512 type:complete len:230 (-) Transcript_67138:675-1364(-)
MDQATTSSAAAAALVPRAGAMMGMSPSTGRSLAFIGVLASAYARSALTSTTSAIWEAWSSFPQLFGSCLLLEQLRLPTPYQCSRSLKRAKALASAAKAGIGQARLQTTAKVGEAKATAGSAKVMVGEGKTSAGAARTVGEAKATVGVAKETSEVKAAAAPALVGRVVLERATRVKAGMESRPSCASSGRHAQRGTPAPSLMGRNNWGPAVLLRWTLVAKEEAQVLSWPP